MLVAGITTMMGMTTMDTDVKRRMTSDEFIAWAMEQPDTEHYELHDGEVVSMSPERHGHGVTKSEISYRLRTAIDKASLKCWVFIDSMAVEIDANTVFEPDIVVRCGDLLEFDATRIVDPLIVVEVLSPSTRGRDLTTKFAGYLNIASLRHYIVVDPLLKRVLHHRRDPAGNITSMILGDQPITLDPPGIVLENIFV